MRSLKMLYKTSFYGKVWNAKPIKEILLKLVYPIFINNMRQNLFNKLFSFFYE